MQQPNLPLTGSFRIGPHTIVGRCVLAPMAGLTDQPFRNLCRDHGAALAVSEMNTADTRLWDTPKSRARLSLDGENGLKIVQIAGSDPTQMAAAARAATALGADIIDINMGCPAKKVCNRLAGSALLQDEARVEAILRAVTAATELPVTLKIRTGWAPDHRNGVRIAQIAVAAGIQALAVHGRTRACMFNGDAEYETIRAIKAAVNIPVLANGDINSAAKARDVLQRTGADAVMIGRGALGRPWLFAEINHALRSDASGEPKNGRALSHHSVRDIILQHLVALHALYGNDRGVRIGRKHLTWYCKYLDNAADFRDTVVRVTSAADQLRITTEFFKDFTTWAGHAGRVLVQESV